MNLNGWLLMKRMNPSIKLEKINGIIKSRGVSHGGWQENMDNTAAFWSHFLGIQISSWQVCVMLCLLKVSRMTSGGKFNIDDFDDHVGYAAMAAACAENEKKEKEV